MMIKTVNFEEELTSMKAMLKRLSKDSEENDARVMR